MSVKRAMREIDREEFRWWIAYHRLEPFGQVRDDLRAGVVASVVANTHRSRGTKTFQPGDFVLKFGKRRVRRDPLQMEREMKAFVAAHNANVKATKKAKR